MSVRPHTPAKQEKGLSAPPVVYPTYTNPFPVAYPMRIPYTPTSAYAGGYRMPYTQTSRGYRMPYTPTSTYAGPYRMPPGQTAVSANWLPSHWAQMWDANKIPDDMRPNVPISQQFARTVAGSAGGGVAAAATDLALQSAEIAMGNGQFDFTHALKVGAAGAALGGAATLMTEYAPYTGGKQ